MAAASIFFPTLIFLIFFIPNKSLQHVGLHSYAHLFFCNTFSFAERPFPVKILIILHSLSFLYGGAILSRMLTIFLSICQILPTEIKLLNDLIIFDSHIGPDT